MCAINEEAVKKAAALFLLKTSEKHKLPLSSLEDHMQDVQQLISIILDHVQAKSAESSSASDANSPEGGIDVFAGLHSTYQQTKYFKEHLGLIVSYNILL